MCWSTENSRGVFVFTAVTGLWRCCSKKLPNCSLSRRLLLSRQLLYFQAASLWCGFGLGSSHSMLIRFGGQDGYFCVCDLIFASSYHWNTSHRADMKSNKFFSPVLLRWRSICYWYFDVCKLFIAFQLLRFLLKWSVRLRFHFGFSFVHAVVRIFPVIDIFWVLGKMIGWRKRECLFLWFFFFLHEI